MPFTLYSGVEVPFCTAERTFSPSHLMITYEFAPGERMGWGWGKDGAGAEPNRTGVWEGTCQPGLSHKGGDRSLMHLPDQSPLPSKARQRKECWRPLACSPCTQVLHLNTLARERPSPQKAFLNPQCLPDVPTRWGLLEAHITPWMAGPAE